MPHPASAPRRAARPAPAIAALARAASAALFALAALACAPARADDDADRAFHLHAAACAAALEIDQHALAHRAAQGATNVRDEMLQVTRLGFTFVAIAWKRGLRNPEGDQLLAAARKEQAAWPAARHAPFAAACRAEAQPLFDDATAVERWLLDRRVAKKVDQLLAKAQAQGASGSASAHAP